MLTQDLNAVIRGVRLAGATGVVVKDSHATCKNLLIDQLEPGTQLISGFGSDKDGMMDGIDATFDAAILVGYHGMAGAWKAMMDHALVGGLHRFWINGEEAGEIAVSAAVAGAYGVPTILVTSDEVGCMEAEKCLANVHTYCTKEGFARYMGRMLHPSETGPGIEEAATLSLRSLPTIQPYTVDGETTMRIEFRDLEQADLPARLEGVERLNGYSLQWTSPNFIEAHRRALAVFSLSMQGRRSLN